MRYGPEHKAETRQKIVKDAAQRVRLEGIAGMPVAAVMRDAGLTHGGFYKHFESKEELLGESVREAFREIAERLTAVARKAPAGSEWKAIVRTYLSPEHCAHAEYGCPLAALGPELARADQAVKAQIPPAIMEYRARMVPFMPGRRVADRERNFLVIFSAMIGAVEIARMLPEKARGMVLESTREFLLGNFDRHDVDLRVRAKT